MLLRDMLLPKAMKFSTDKADPSRAKLRSDTDEPTVLKPRTDREKTDPTRDNPNTDTDDPNLE